MNVPMTSAEYIRMVYWSVSCLRIFMNLKVDNQMNKLTAIVAATTDIHIFPPPILVPLFSVLSPLPVAPSCRRCHVWESTTVVTPHLPPTYYCTFSYSFKSDFFVQKNAKMWKKTFFVLVFVTMFWYVMKIIQQHAPIMMFYMQLNLDTANSRW